MILLPWACDRCPCCGAVAVPRWWKLHRETRTCPACGGKVELSRISRSLLGGIWIGFASMLVFLLLAVATDPGWESLVLVTMTIVAVGWILTWLPLTVPQGNAPRAPESPNSSWSGHAMALAAAAALAVLAAGFLIAAMAFEFPDHAFTLIVLGAGIGIGAAIGLLFDLPLVAATAASDRWMDRWPWPKQPWQRRLLRGAARLAVVGALAFAFVKAVMLLD